MGIEKNYTINVNGEWWRYANIIPDQYIVVGVVKIGSVPGVLARCKETNIYVQITATTINPLPQDEIKALLEV